MAGSRSFPLSYNRLTRALVAPLAGRHGRVDVDDSHVEVHVGAVFRASIPRSSIRTAAPWTGRVTGYGAHGWRGTWLVNGSGRGLVALTLQPDGRGWVTGVPVRLRELRLSLEDPEGFLAALEPAG